MSVLFGKPPKMSKTATTQNLQLLPFVTSKLDIQDAVARVLQLPISGFKELFDYNRRQVCHRLGGS
ncbi:hypothetical protein HF325_005032 [Metschnikowia pulcherrima]|uniref:Uncharacterized protein n=1 Tax=Metschnikowia pulcherrima TaxID=27326 RepID=A0A8H7L9T2_9ASCO|nr:hypothetical protein HF325_005032 [Metschnikowia pulcherrima]